MGKYDRLKNKLPKFEQEPSFQAKVEESKSAYQALEATDLAREFNLVRKMKRNHEEEISKLNIALEALSQMLVENFEATGLQKMQLATGETCYQQSEPYSSVQDQAALLAFIKKQKLQNLLTLQWQTMNAMNKDRLLSGLPPMPGTQAFLKTSVRLRHGSA